MGDNSVYRITDATDFVAELEKLLGPRVMEALKDQLNYVYFGTSDMVYIIQSKPRTFERAMRDIFGFAGTAIIERVCNACELQAIRA